jgi:2-dehydropantoate 2-reductase
LYVAADKLTLGEDPALLAGAAIVLVTVKSRDTAEMADQIACYAPQATVVSLQNGVENVAVLRERLAHAPVLAGMVPFNVLSQGEGCFHRATTGDVLIAADPANTARALSVAGMAVHPREDMAGVQWGKLLINLNNALNALSGLPLREQLSQRGWRALLARQMREALRVIAAEGVRPVSSTPLPMPLVPLILQLPDALFARVAGAMLRIDPAARSSMWDDLEQRRPTEIDYLQGVVVRLAARHGLEAPQCARIVELVKQAEADKRGAPHLTPQQVALP